MTTLAEEIQESAAPRAPRRKKTGSLDGMEQALLELLQQEGRMPNTTIAARLNVSEGSVRRRLKRLLENQTMSVVAVPNWKALGYSTEALVGLRVVLYQLDAVAAHLASLKAVQSVATVTGPFDIFCTVIAKSPEDLARFLETEVASIAGVRSVQTFLALSVNKRGHQPLAA